MTQRREAHGGFSSEWFTPTAGLSLMLAWIYAPLLSGEVFYLFFHLSFGCALLCVATLYARRQRATCLFAMAPLAACILMCSAPITVFLLDKNDPLLQATSGVLCGVGASYCFCRWFLAFSAFPTRESVRYTLLAFSLSAVMRLALTAITAVLPPMTGVFLLAMPFISTRLMARLPAPREGMWLVRVQGEERLIVTDVGKETRSVEISNRHTGSMDTGLAPILLEIVAYGLIFGLLRNEVMDWSNTTYSMLVGHVLRIVLPLFLFQWAARRIDGRKSHESMRWPLTVTAILLLAAVFFGEQGAATLSAVILAVRSLISILIYLRLFEALYRSKLHPCAIYGIGRAVYELALVGGLLVYDQTMVRTSLEALPENVIYFAVSTALVLLLGAFARATTLPFMHSTPLSPASIDQRCAELAERFGLSERETQIMKRTALGRSKRHIAEELHLTEDTIRYHTKRYYKKLGVHNRQELLTLLGVG